METLNLHISTCEIYECSNCYYRVKSLSDIRKHFENKHTDEEEDVKILHGKVNRKCDEEIDETEHFYNELFD